MRDEPLHRIRESRAARTSALRTIGTRRCPRFGRRSSMRLMKTAPPASPETSCGTADAIRFLASRAATVAVSPALAGSREPPRIISSRLLAQERGAALEVEPRMTVPADAQRTTPAASRSNARPLPQSPQSDVDASQRLRQSLDRNVLCRYRRAVVLDMRWKGFPRVLEREGHEVAA